MSIDHRLIHLLVCPLCKSALVPLRDDEQRLTELGCRADHLAFPIRDGMPVMLEQEARAWTPDEAGAPAGGTP